MASAWRQLNFFQSRQVLDAESPDTAGASIFSTTSQGSVVVADHGFVFVGDQSGTIHALDEQFATVATVLAYPKRGVDHLITCPQGLIAAIGQDESDQAVLKVWELRSNKNSKHSFKHLSSVVIYNDRPFPITCLSAVDDLTHVAIGLSDGRVILIKGDLVRDRGAKQRTIYEGEEPITALEFLSDRLYTVLHIFSTSKLLTLQINHAAGRSTTQVPKVKESVGAALNCVAKDRLKNEIVVVRQDAIYVYSVQGRGPCYALEGPKKSLYMHNGYAVMIHSPNSATSGTMKVLGKIGIPDAIEDATRITILQTTHKFVAHTGYFPQGLRLIFSAWNSLHLLTVNGRIFRLDEVEEAQQLEILYQKSMFTLALSIAEERSMSEERLNHIRLHYGDYLYERGDFEAAVKQYIQAIRQCEASSIMRKFLEAQHIPLLAEFLEALHAAGLSNGEYTTLLLNCYAKLKHKDKLTSFINNQADHAIDLEIAVALCRQAGYFDQAITLTTKHKNHSICLGIMIEDKKDFQGALQYIKKLKDAGDVGSMLNQFGRELMSKALDETTRLFIDFYTGAFIPQSDIYAAGVMSPPRGITTGYGAAFYDSMINSRYTQVLPSLPSLDMSQLNPMRRVTSMSASITSEKTSTADTSDAPEHKEDAATDYAVPAPRTAFPIFADYTPQFVQFLEAILERQVSTLQDQIERSDVVSTLLEAYLRLAKQAAPEAKNKWQEKAKHLVKAEESFIESPNAMLLFHLSSFEEGSFMMQEKIGRKEDVFRSYCNAKDTKGVIETLRRYGEEEPQLYVLALKYFISDTKIVIEAGPELGKVLDKIHEKRLLAPLQVIQTMSMNAVANVGIVKEYLSGIIDKERKEILTDQSLIESYRKEASSKEKEASDLAKNAMVLQVTRCARCSGTLELPVVHFLCKHSFHSRCIVASGDNMECPVCLESNHAVQTMVKSKAELAEKQDFLKESLANSRDKANYLFSRMDLNVESSVS